MLFAQVINILGNENVFGYRYAKYPDEHGVYASEQVIPVTRRSYMAGIFVSFKGRPEI
jgi:hypothetical protein